MTIQASVNLLGDVIKSTPEYQNYMQALSEFEQKPEIMKQLNELNEIAESHFEKQDKGVLTEEDIKSYLQRRELFREQSVVKKLIDQEHKLSGIMRSISDEISEITDVDFTEGADTKMFPDDESED